MQFSKLFLVAATAASAAAAPVASTPSSECRTADPIKCQNSGGKWKPSWTGAADKDKYICYTTGLVNILNCASILNGNTVNVDLGSLLSLL